MAFQITATASAGTGIYLLVKVLNGATETGGANASVGNGTPNASLTPNGTASLIVEALQNNDTTTLFTMEASNTAYDSAADANNGGSYAHASYTGTVTGGTPVTVGASAPAATNLAAYEILASAGSTPSVDSSSPPLIISTTALTVTTTPFNPPNYGVIACMIGVYNTTGVATMTVTGGGLTWTTRASAAPSAEGAVFIVTSSFIGNLVLPDSGAMASHAVTQPFTAGWRNAGHSR